MIRAATEFPNDPDEHRRLRLAFVCTENANRSQMAEAFARAIGGDVVEAHSAGSRPAVAVNPKAIESMHRIGYDLSGHLSKPVSQIEHLEFDVVITLGCGDVCPTLRASRREDWAVPDPKHLPPDQFDRVRDLIGQKVRRLIAELCATEM